MATLDELFAEREVLKTCGAFWATFRKEVGALIEAAKEGQEIDFAAYGMGGVTPDVALTVFADLKDLEERAIKAAADLSATEFDLDEEDDPDYEEGDDDG